MNYTPASNDATVFIIDDDLEICKALSWLMESVKLNVVCFGCPIEFLDQYNPNQYGCIITDIRMPTLSGLQLLEQLNLLKNKLPVIIITGHGDIPMAVKAMKMGAVDFISKPFNDQYLIEQVQKSIAQSILLHQEATDHNIPFEKLSKREKEVMGLIAKGMMNKQIAHELNISISTVEFHRSRLMKKTKTKNVAELIKSFLSSEDFK